MSTPNWIELSTHHYQTTKSLNIRRRFGSQGYGIYLMLLQKIASEENRSLPLTNKPDIAFEFQCEEKIISDIINNYFDADDLVFWSDELNNELMKKYDENYIKHSEGGKITANQLTPQERIEKGRKAANARWHKDDKENAN